MQYDNLLIIKNQNQLDYYLEHKSDFKNDFVLMTLPNVYYKLKSIGSVPLIWCGDYLSSVESAHIEDEAVRFSKSWIGPLSKNLTFRGIDLVELIEVAYLAFFRQKLRMEYVFPKILNEKKISKVKIFKEEEVACINFSRVDNTNTVLEAIMRYEALKHELELVEIEYNKNRTEHMSELNDSVDYKRVSGVNCWEKINSKRLLAFGGGFDMFLLHPYVKAWNQLENCEGILFNPSLTLEKDTGRAGQDSDLIQFVCLREFESHKPSSMAVHTQNKILKTLQKWSKRRIADKGNSLCNPLLNFQLNHMWSELYRLPLLLDKMSKALEVLAPDAVLVSDMMSIPVRALLKLARKKNILTVNLPHGLVTPCIDEYVPYGDLYLAWGETTKKILSEQGLDANIKVSVVGAANVEKFVLSDEPDICLDDRYRELGLNPDKKTLCVVTEPQSSLWQKTTMGISEYESNWDSIIAFAIKHDWQVLIKAHPYIDNYELYDYFAKQYDFVSVFRGKLDKVVPITDVALMFYYVSEAAFAFIKRDIIVYYILSEVLQSKFYTSEEILKLQLGDSLEEQILIYCSSEDRKQKRIFLQKEMMQNLLSITDTKPAKRAANLIYASLSEPKENEKNV